MVEHGKRCERCAKNGKPRKESHGPCPLVNLAHAASHLKKLNAEEAASAAEATLKEENLVKDEDSEIVKDEDSEADDLKQEADGKIEVKEEEVAVKEEPGVKNDSSKKAPQKRATRKGVKQEKKGNKNGTDKSESQNSGDNMGVKVKAECST